MLTSKIVLYNYLDVLQLHQYTLHFRQFEYDKPILPTQQFLEETAFIMNHKEHAVYVCIYSDAKCDSSYRKKDLHQKMAVSVLAVVFTNTYKLRFR